MCRQHQPTANDRKHHKKMYRRQSGMASNSAKTNVKGSQHTVYMKPRSKWNSPNGTNSMRPCNKCTENRFICGAAWKLAACMTDEIVYWICAQTDAQINCANESMIRELLLLTLPSLSFLMLCSAPRWPFRDAWHAIGMKEYHELTLRLAMTSLVRNAMWCILQPIMRASHSVNEHHQLRRNTSNTCMRIHPDELNNCSLFSAVRLCPDVILYFNVW